MFILTVSLSYNDMDMGLPSGLSIANAGLQYILCLFDELAMEIDCVFCDTARCVVLSENELGGLFIVFGLLLLVPLAFIRQLFCLRLITTLISLMGLPPKVYLSARRNEAILVTVGAVVPGQSKTFSCLLQLARGRGGDHILAPSLHWYGG